MLFAIPITVPFAMRGIGYIIGSSIGLFQKYEQCNSIPIFVQSDEKLVRTPRDLGGFTPKGIYT